MPLTLEPGCIARRKPSTGTGTIARHLTVLKVFPAMGIAKCAYFRYGNRYGYKFVDIAISKLDVVLNSPDRIQAEALAATQPDPYPPAGYNSGNSGTRPKYTRDPNK